jgi:ribosomal protein L34E
MPDNLPDATSGPLFWTVGVNTVKHSAKKKKEPCGCQELRLYVETTRRIRHEEVRRCSEMKKKSGN